MKWCLFKNDSGNDSSEIEKIALDSSFRYVRLDIANTQQHL